MASEELTRDEIMEILNQRADEMRNRFNVLKIGLFGSYARSQPGQKSDVDILVELGEVTFDNYMELKFFLQHLLKRGVDLVLADTLKQRLKPRIMSEVIYAQGL